MLETEAIQTSINEAISQQLEDLVKPCVYNQLAYYRTGASRFLTKYKYSGQYLGSNRHIEASTFEIRFLDSIVHQQS